MEAILIVLVIMVLLALLLVALCKTSGRDSRQEEKEHPCANCQRWGECNGVDETCPWLQ